MHQTCRQQLGGRSATFIELASNDKPVCLADGHTIVKGYATKTVNKLLKIVDAFLE